MYILKKKGYLFGYKIIVMDRFDKRGLSRGLSEELRLILHWLKKKTLLNNSKEPNSPSSVNNFISNLPKY